jgi:hypothetical protein
LLNSNYIVLDAARMGMDMETAKEMNPDFKCLYQGKTELELAGVAPFLFTYSSNSEFKQWFEKFSIGNSWGVLFHSHLPFSELYKHCRRFLIVKNDGEQEMYFRFYDPRVLRIFLPTCNRVQLKEFFGPINSFIVEDEDPNSILQFTFDNIRLNCNRISRIESENQIDNDEVVIHQNSQTYEEEQVSEPKISINKSIHKEKSSIDLNPKSPAVSESINKWNKFFFD